MKDYQELIGKINMKISEFSQFLNPKYVIPLLGIDKFDDKDHFCNLTTTKWEDQKWPNSWNTGVYFLFGRKIEDGKTVGVYIGKSSFKSAMGHRIYTHLNSQYRVENKYFMQRLNDRYSLEFLATIPLGTLDIGFLSPALEEFMITKLSSEVNLLNGTGN
jgi:hypothetical protein